MDNSSVVDNEPDLHDKLVIGLTYLAVSVLMILPYCISWFVIMRDKTIYDPAFRLFALSMGCADMELLLSQGFFPSMAGLLPIEISQLTYKVMGAVGADAWYTYASLAQMMSLSRLISVFWPIESKNIYTVRNTRIIIILCWVQGLVWMSFYLAPDATLRFDMRQKGMSYDFSMIGTSELYAANMIFNYIHGFSLCLIYALIYLQVRRKRKQILDPAIANDCKKERRVLIQSCVICSMDLAVIVTWAVFQRFTGTKGAIFVASILSLSSAGSTGYMYIVMNSSVREQALPLLSFCCPRRTATDSVQHLQIWLENMDNSKPPSGRRTTASSSESHDVML